MHKAHPSFLDQSTRAFNRITMVTDPLYLPTGMLLTAIHIFSGVKEPVCCQNNAQPGTYIYISEYILYLTVRFQSPYCHAIFWSKYDCNGFISTVYGLNFFCLVKVYIWNDSALESWILHKVYDPLVKHLFVACSKVSQ